MLTETDKQRALDAIRFLPGCNRQVLDNGAP